MTDLDDALRQSIDRLFDRDLHAATTSNAKPADPLTLERLHDMIKAWALELRKPSQPRFLDMLYPELGPRLPSQLGGILVHHSPHLPKDHIGHWIETIPITRQPRSKRLWKKLRQRRQRRARPMLVDVAYMVGGQLFAPPVLMRQLREISADYTSV
jgi:hypothetical protein